MSKIRMVEQATAPGTPGTNEVLIYANSSGELCIKNDAGTASVFPGYTASTWTPALSFGGAAVSMTYTSRVGTYTKIGDICFFQGAFVLSAKGSSTGSCLVSGLPFTSRNTAGMYVPVGVQWVNMTSSLVYAMGVQNLNTATFTINGGTAAMTTVNVLTHADFSDTSQIRFSGYYFV